MSKLEKRLRQALKEADAQVRRHEREVGILSAVESDLAEELRDQLGFVVELGVGAVGELRAYAAESPATALAYAEEVLTHLDTSRDPRVILPNPAVAQVYRDVLDRSRL